MSTAAVSTSSIYHELQAYFQQRGSDLQKLGQALQSGDLAGAQQEFAAIQNLGQHGPFANGDPFKISQREQDFTAIGQALQSGDLAGAQQAFAQLKSSFRHRSVDPPAPDPGSVGGAASGSSSGASVSGSGTEIVLNLGNLTPGEQVTIGVSNAGNGAEQVTIGLANQNQSPEQITLNLSQNSNQQIILNLFNSTANAFSPGAGVSVTA